MLKRYKYIEYTKNGKGPFIAPGSGIPPTEDEIQLRIEREKRLNKLGMSLSIEYLLSHDEEQYEDMDKLKAYMLIMQDKEVPPELEQRIIKNNLKQQRKQEKLDEQARIKREKRNQRLLRNGKTPR